MRIVTDISEGHTCVLVVNAYNPDIIGNHGFMDERNINRTVNNDKVCGDR